MKAVDTKMRHDRWICADEGFTARLLENGLETLEALSSRSLGEAVTDHRSSWVRRWSDGSRTYFIKTYDYPRPGDQWRGIGRTTLFARSRAAREGRALRWLAQRGFGGPAVRAIGEIRHLLLLRRAVLVTDAWPGEDLASLLPSLPDDERATLLSALTRFLHALHAAGFRDRNLDPRNLLARRSAGGWEIVKIDSPRHRITRPDRAHDRLAREDWQRLSRGLRDLGLPWPLGEATAIDS